MATNNIKDIWRAKIDENIKLYSGKELNKMVVKAAHKSMQRVFPGTIFRLVIISVIILLVTGVFFKNQQIELRLIDLAALVILSIAYLHWEYYAYQMKKYITGKPVKEWLEYRIKEIEQNIKFNTKYTWLLYGCSFLTAIGYNAAYLIVTKTTPGILFMIGIPLGLIIYLLLVRRYQYRNYQKALHELQDLYKQFEESTK